MDERTLKHVKKSLRRGFVSWDERLRCIELSRQADDRFLCAKCKKSYYEKMIECDHINPIGEFINLDDYISKIFVSANDLQILCKNCHKEKTKNENLDRRIKKFGSEAMEKEIARKWKKEIKKIKQQLAQRSSL